VWSGKKLPTDVSEKHNASIFRILDYLSVKMKAIHSFETSVTIYPTWCNIPEDTNFRHVVTP